MKCIYHKQDDRYRVMQRGTLYYAQHNDGSASTREHDPWQDTGTAQTQLDSALALIYMRKPMVEARRA